MNLWHVHSADSHNHNQKHHNQSKSKSREIFPFIVMFVIAFGDDDSSRLFRITLNYNIVRVVARNGHITKAKEMKRKKAIRLRSDCCRL